MSELKAADDHRPKKHGRYRTKHEALMKLRKRRADRAARFAEVQSRAVARVLGFGGGVNTVAQLLREPEVYDYAIFADVGAEEPPTYEYIDKYVKPFCEEKGIKFVMVRSHRGTLEEHCRKKKILPIIARRWCTDNFKIEPVNKFIRGTLRATAEHPVILDMGFTIDEATRAAGDDKVKHAYQNYPLVDAKITREDCYKIIREHGWEIPAKSACDFCMFHGPRYFQQLSKDNPRRFGEIMAMEENCAGFPKLSIIPGTTLRKLRDSGGAYANTMDQYCTSGTCFR